MYIVIIKCLTPSALQLQFKGGVVYIVIIECLTPYAQLPSFDSRGVPCTLL